MEAAIAKQFIDFFDDFLKLCQLANWPHDNTSELEIRNAFTIGQHIEKCLSKLENQDILDDFLTAVGNNDNNTFKHCLSDPSKYLLRKIIQSKSKITVMDVAFQVVVQMYSEEKLEKCLSELLLEAASVETLLRNLNTSFPRKTILMYKSQLFLREINSGDDSKEYIADMLKTGADSIVEVLVMCILCKDYKYQDCVIRIVNVFVQVMVEKTQACQLFWRTFLKIEEQNLIEVCLNHGDIFVLIVGALLDCSKLLKEMLSSEYFYISFTYSELVTVVRCMCKSDTLKRELLAVLKQKESDLYFWENILDQS